LERIFKIRGDNMPNYITDEKQAHIIDTEKVQQWKIRVFGLGSIGSIFVKQAALVGFKDIIGYDFDEVELANLASQEYRKCHIGMKKTDAVKAMMKEDYDFDVGVVDGEITEETPIIPDENTIYFCAFDSLEARKIVWDKIKNFPVVWCESRIGRTSQRYYFIDLRNRNEEQIAEYEKSLDPTGPRTELKCGEKGTYPSNAELVAKMLRQMVNIVEGKPLATLFIGDWGNPPAIFIAPKEEVPAEVIYEE
jgi:molybdopterin/thiamine biosynthesis adenylyltransferase